MRTGASDAEIARLRAAVAPLSLPADVESLLQWHNGSTEGVFGYWAMLDCEAIIGQREDRWPSQPPAWLELFTRYGRGVVMLHVAGAETLPGVWLFHPDSDGIEKYFDSVANMIEVSAAAIATGALVWRESGGFSDPDPLHSSWNAIRRAGTTDSVIRRDSMDEPVDYERNPEGSYFDRFAEPGWPQAWLISMGLPDGVAPLRGATDTIAEGAMPADLSGHSEQEIRFLRGAGLGTPATTTAVRPLSEKH